MNRGASIFKTLGVVLFAPLSFFWQLLNQFLLSPWGFIIPMTLLIALFAVLQLQKTPAQIVRFYAEQLEICDEVELPLLLEVLVRSGEVGVSGLVKGLASQRESVFTACQNVLQQEFDRWKETDQREHHFVVFSEALLQTCGQFSSTGQAEAIRFVDQIMQIRSVTDAPGSTSDRQKTIAHCEQILAQLESMRRKRIEPQHPDFAPSANTVASLDRRTRQPVLLASNGQPFVPTSARNNGGNETLLTDAGSFNTFSVSRGDRLWAYQKSRQNRPAENGDNPRLSEDWESPEFARFSALGSESLPSSFTSDIERKIAQNFSENNSDRSNFADISENYRDKKLSESGGTFDSDNFLTSEILDMPLDRVPNLPTTQLMRLLHHPAPSYVESARKTLTGRDGFQETHLKLAWRLYHPIPAVRQEIMEMLPNTPNVQPSVWLTVLLSDPSNEVRYRTASFLATTHDPALQRLLIDRGKRDTDVRIVNLADRLNESQRESVRR